MGRGLWIWREVGRNVSCMNELVPDSWKAALAPALSREVGRSLEDFLSAQEAAGKAIYPPRGSRLKALELTPLEKVKVVILGQDPYHGPGQAMGLAFSVPQGVKLPPSLRNIYKELASDLGQAMPAHGDLTKWAQEGVLLLNTTLTVEEGKAGSHAGRGWDAVTDACIAAVAAREDPAVFILWGSHAQAKAKRIPALQSGRHLVIESPHPSPLSAYRGFFGSRPFSRANEFLQASGLGPVDWTIPA